MAKIASKITGDGFVRFEFIDGEVVQCDVASLPDEIIHRLALHGLSQKVGDSYAGAASVTEARIMADTVYKNLVAGMWATKATRGVKIIEAIHRAMGIPLDVALEKWSLMDDGKKKAVRAHPDIKKALAEIEAERAAKLAAVATDTGENLNDLF